MLIATVQSQVENTLVPSPNWNSSSQLVCKRAVDLLVSTFLLILLCPVFLVVALLVKLSSPGPVLYKWQIVGRNGIPLTSYKFRSMVMNADELKSQLVSRNEMKGPVFKLTLDPRVTPVGAWIRRYSLDELPQLYSVLTGEMALVGPRPPLRTEYVHFTEYQKQKLTVKPGITCLWQVNGRNEVKNFDDWVSLDLEYIRRFSLWLDLAILLKTVGAVFSGSGK